MIIGLAMAGLLAGFGVFQYLTLSKVMPRPVRLVVSGPDGQRFSGRYVADGVTNIVSALAPATFSLQASNVDFEFTRDGGGGEFRVGLFVGHLCRTSVTSDTHQGVRGQLRYTADWESYWAAAY